MTARTWRPDGPGSFQAPHGVQRVHDRHGRLWTRGPTRWTADGARWIRWRALVADHGPVTEATAPTTAHGDNGPGGRTPGPPRHGPAACKPPGGAAATRPTRPAAASP